MVPLYSKQGERFDVLLNTSPRWRTKDQAQDGGAPPLWSASPGEPPFVKRGEPPGDVSGQVTGVIAIGQDITSIARSQRELRQVANDLEQVIDNANAPIFGVDANGLINEWNRKAAELTGYATEEVMGQHLVNSFIRMEYRANVDEVLCKALAGTPSGGFTFPLFRKDGERLEVLLNATARFDDHGRGVGVVGVGQDVTEFTRSQRELSHVANDFRMLIETANAPIFGIDADGLINEWNRKAAAITGFSKDEVMGRSLVRDFITAEFQESVQEVLQNALGGKETANFEFPLYTKDGRPVDILLNAATRRGPDEQIVGVVGVGQDFTELKQEKVEMSRVAGA